MANCPAGYTLNRVSNQCERTTTVTSQQCKVDETFLAEVGLCVKTFTTCK